MQERLQKLYDGVHELLCISPPPHMCSEEENAVYSDLANLKLKLSDLIQKEKKFIKIWYSWGDEEPAIEVPVGEDPWEYMKKLAVKEAEVSFADHEDEGEIGLQFFKDEGKIILHYPYDNSYCYYQINANEEKEANEEKINLVIINCDDKFIEYEWNTVNDFFADMNSDKENIPMFDDRISTLYFYQHDYNEKDLQEKGIITVQDFYDWCKELPKINEKNILD